MSYLYRKTKKKINVGSNKGERYVLAMAPQNKITSDEVCQYIGKNSSISEQDIKILMRALADVINENIEIGRGVNLKDLGVFSPNFKSSGSDTVEDVSAQNIEQVVVNFRPAAKFREEMDNAPVKETSIYKLKHEKL